MKVNQEIQRDILKKLIKHENILKNPQTYEVAKQKFCKAKTNYDNNSLTSKSDLLKAAYDVMNLEIFNNEKTSFTDSYIAKKVPKSLKKECKKYFNESKESFDKTKGKNDPLKSYAINY